MHDSSTTTSTSQRLNLFKQQFTQAVEKNDLLYSDDPKTFKSIGKTLGHLYKFITNPLEDYKELSKLKTAELSEIINYLKIIKVLNKNDNKEKEPFETICQQYSKIVENIIHDKKVFKDSLNPAQKFLRKIQRSIGFSQPPSLSPIYLARISTATTAISNSLFPSEKDQQEAMELVSKTKQNIEDEEFESRLLGLQLPNVPKGASKDFNDNQSNQGQGSRPATTRAQARTKAPKTEIKNPASKNLLEKIQNLSDKFPEGEIKTQLTNVVKIIQDHRAKTQETKARQKEAKDKHNRNNPKRGRT